MHQEAVHTYQQIVKNKNFERGGLWLGGFQKDKDTQRYALNHND
jgi:hypothetical protein